MTIARYGWRRDTPDHRDLVLGAALAPPHVLPPRVDLRATGLLDWPIYDQGALGSCTANAIAAAVRFAEAKEGAADHTPTAPSRLFIYYEERRIEGSIGSDAGAELRDGLKVVARVGYPDETLWPYDPSLFADRPLDSVYAAARRDHVTRYYRVPTWPAAMKAALALGYPIIVGFTVYASLETADVARTGVVPMPGQSEPVVGGHAVLCVGYDDETRRWAFRNSWGCGWGEAGYGYLPYGYLDSPALAGDFWVVQRETTG